MPINCGSRHQQRRRRHVSNSHTPIPNLVSPGKEEPEVDSQPPNPKPGSLSRRQQRHELVRRRRLREIERRMNSMNIVRRMNSMENTYQYQPSSSDDDEVCSDSDAGVIGPQRSEWMSCSLSVALHLLCFGIGDRCCFPFIHVSHVIFSSPICGPFMVNGVPVPCDVCGGTHSWTRCPYFFRFPPDGHLVNQQEYVVVCECGEFIVNDRCPSGRCYPCRLRRVEIRNLPCSPPYDPAYVPPDDDDDDDDDDDYYYS